MRKNFIDNIRILCILLLFPFHTCMIYNNWGEQFYITDRPFALPSYFAVTVYPWWMNLLFAIAGMSSYYALKKRTVKEYARERIEKLLIPLLSGLLIVVPVQSYIADIYHNAYTGGYFAHYKIFFSRFTDLSGGDGGFTPAHLWFIFYLFIISMLMLQLMYRYIKSDKKIDGSKIKLVHLLPMFLLILICAPILEIGNKSIGESLACFALGFFVLSDEQVQEMLERNCLLLAVLFALALAGRLVMQANGYMAGLLWDIEQRMVTWFGILAILAAGKRYLNFSNAITGYFSGAAFSLYYFHQSILVLLGYFVLSYVNEIWLSFSIIMIGSFILSILCYELCRRFRLSAFLFGIKYSRKQEDGNCRICSRH